MSPLLQEAIATKDRAEDLLMYPMNKVQRQEVCQMISEIKQLIKQYYL